MGDYTGLIVSDGDVSTSGVNGKLWLFWSSTGTATGFSRKKMLDRTVGQWNEHLHQSGIVSMSPEAGLSSGCTTALTARRMAGSMGGPPPLSQRRRTFLQAPREQTRVIGSCRASWVSACQTPGATSIGQTPQRWAAAPTGRYGSRSGSPAIFGNRAKSTVTGDHKAVIPTVANGHTLMQIKTQAAEERLPCVPLPGRVELLAVERRGRQPLATEDHRGAVTSFYTAASMLPSKTILEAF